MKPNILRISLNGLTSLGNDRVKMKRKKAVRLVTVFSLIAILTNLAGFKLVFSATGSVGVKPGDMMIHDLLFEGIPPPVYADFIFREVLSVDGTWIKLNYTAFLSNKTIDTKIVEGDLMEGPEYIFPVIIPSNLEVGDEIYSEALEKLGIKGGRIIVKGERTAEVKLGGGGHERTFVRTLIYSEFSYGTPPWPSANVTAEWDKTTGILAYMYSRQRDFNLTVKLVETNAITENVGSSFLPDYRLIVALATLGLLTALVTYSIFKSQGKRKRGK